MKIKNSDLHWSCMAVYTEVNLNVSTCYIGHDQSMVRSQYLWLKQEWLTSVKSCGRAKKSHTVNQAEHDDNDDEGHHNDNDDFKSCMWYV